jgi:hypothetical protein
MCCGATLRPEDGTAAPKVVLPICFLFSVVRLVTRDSTFSSSTDTIPPTLSNPRCQPVSHTKTEKDKLLNRVRRVRGQIEAVERAHEGE